MHELFYFHSGLKGDQGSKGNLWNSLQVKMTISHHKTQENTINKNFTCCQRRSLVYRDVQTEHCSSVPPHCKPGKKKPTALIFYHLQSIIVSQNYIRCIWSPISPFICHFHSTLFFSYSLFLFLHSIPPPVISASIQELWGGGGSAAFSVVWGCGWAAKGVPSHTWPSSPPHTWSGPPMTHTAG